MKIDVDLEVMMDVVNAVVVQELKQVYIGCINDVMTIPDDIKYTKKLKKCTKFLLKNYTTPKEFEEFMESLDELTKSD